MKIRTMATATALASIGSLSIVGAASAAGPVAGRHAGHGRLGEVVTIANTGKLPSTFSCKNADRDLGAISYAEGVVNTRITKGTAAEAAATSAGDTAKAAAIAAKVAKGTKLEADLAKVSSLIVNDCPGASATSPAGQAATARLASRHGHLAQVVAIAKADALPSNFSCSNAASDQAKIKVFETKLNARIARAQAKETAATSNGNTAVAERINNRLTKAEALRGDLVKVNGLISARCAS